MNGFRFSAVHPLLEALRRIAASDGVTLAHSAYARGLAVTSLDGSTRPIPITATPVIIDATQIRQRANLSARLSSAAVKMARSILAGPDRELIAGALAPRKKRIPKDQCDRQPPG